MHLPRHSHGVSKLTLDVRELRDVPMSELLLSFPATYIRMKPLDIVRLLVLGSASVSVLVHMCVLRWLSLHRLRAS